MMTQKEKKKLEQQLENLYFEALIAGNLNYQLDDRIKRTYGLFSLDSSNILPAEMGEIEEKLYGSGLNGAKTLASKPGQRAYKRWLELKDSPLSKALNEQ